MPTTAIARLQAEAARCDRLASGLSNPDLIASLSRWATEYRADARRLARCASIPAYDRH